MKADYSLVMAAAGTLLSVIWLAVYMKGIADYRQMSSSKALQRLKFSGLFPAGFGIMKCCGMNAGSSRFASRRDNITEIYGEHYAVFYTLIHTAAQLSYASFLVPVSLLAGAAAGSVMTAAAGILSAALMLYVIDGEVKKKVEEKHGLVMCELPDIIVRLTLLLNAGMVLRDAWNTVAESTDTALGREMRQTGSDIRNGMPETEAFNSFAQRCRTREIRKFSGALVQNLKKGSAGLSVCLQNLADEQWDEKKNYIRRKSAASEQKLLFPMLMIFTAIIMMIIVPVFTNMM